MMKKFAVCIAVAAFALAINAVAQDKKPAKPAKPAAAKPPQDKSKAPEISAADLAKIEAALPAKATASPKSARKILVFWRCEGFFHGAGIAVGNKAIELMGAKTGAYTVDISRDYEAFDNLAKYDAVILNNTTGLKLSDTQQKALLAFVRNGKGLVGVHAATDNFYQWEDGAKMMGGLFCGHPWGGGGTWAFKIDEPNHTLTKVFGGKGFKLKDEIYQFKDPYTRADRRVLLSIDLSDEVTGKVNIKAPRADKDYAVSWIKKEGNGRVFYCSLGHAGNVFEEPTILQFYLDGIQYALGDLEADASPK